MYIIVPVSRCGHFSLNLTLWSNNSEPVVIIAALRNFYTFTFQYNALQLIFEFFQFGKLIQDDLTVKPQNKAYFLRGLQVNTSDDGMTALLANHNRPLTMCTWHESSWRELQLGITWSPWLIGLQWGKGVKEITDWLAKCLGLMYCYVLKLLQAPITTGWVEKLQVNTCQVAFVQWLQLDFFLWKRNFNAIGMLSLSVFRLCPIPEDKDHVVLFNRKDYIFPLKTRSFGLQTWLFTHSLLCSSVGFKLNTKHKAFSCTA